MSGHKFLVDTNVVINHLAGDKNVEILLENSIIYLSGLSYAELLSGNITSEEKIIGQEYVSSVHLIHTNDFICKTAAELRKQFRIKLPDALIASTSIFLNIPLVTFDHDFEK